LDHIINIECGIVASYALDIDENIYAWGKNEDGQLGLGDKIERCK